MVQQQHRRRVRFSEESNQSLEFERLEGESENAWWPKEAGHERKETCHVLGRAWQRKGYDILLNSSFEKPAPGTQGKLDAFAALGDNDGAPRGIERYISVKHAEDRRFCKSHCLESVVDLCTALQRKHKSAEEMEEELHKLSTELSRLSRKFARRMGVADERAVREAEGLMVDNSSSSNEQPVLAAATEHPSMSSGPLANKDGLPKGFSSRAFKNTKRITKMITEHMRSGQR